MGTESSSTETGAASALRSFMRRIRPSDRTIVRAVRWITALAICVANLIGAVIVFILLVWVIPLPESRSDDSTIVNLVLAAGYVALALPIGVGWTLRRLGPGRGWIDAEDRPPTLAEQRSVLRAPLQVFAVVGALWGAAAAVFAVVNLTYSFELAQRVFVTVVLGGLATCSIAYLLTEWLLRPLAARALAERPLEDPVVPGVMARTVLTWALGSGVPMFGLAAVGLSVLIDEDLSRDQLAVAILALTGTGLFLGLLTTLIAARVTADPIISVRKAVSQVADGDLEVEVEVYDGSELGMLQSGFNQMVSGLRERERIRDLFGRHVGEDVAREALEREGALGGEVREVAVLFIDMVGSTELASSRPATEVVEVINEFFGVVVECIDDAGGWVNKFEGDAALAIFGAPEELDDASGRALGAARAMAGRIASEVDGMEAGIGISFGEVVAGNIGGAKRFEYTVIGDAVNEAARLTELAKDYEGMVLASATAIDSASGTEGELWELGAEVELRGRNTRTRLAMPAG